MSPVGVQPGSSVDLVAVRCRGAELETLEKHAVKANAAAQDVYHLDNGYIWLDATRAGALGARYSRADPNLRAAQYKEAQHSADPNPSSNPNQSAFPNPPTAFKSKYIYLQQKQIN